MIIRKPIGYILVLLCFFLFSACGGDGDTAAAPADEPTDEPADEITAQPTNTDCVLGTSILDDCTL